MLVTVVCDLLVASEELLCTLREGAGQAAVTGLVCQQGLILLAIHSLGGQGEGVLALSLVDVYKRQPTSFARMTLKNSDTLTTTA